MSQLIAIIVIAASLALFELVVIFHYMLENRRLKDNIKARIDRDNEARQKLATFISAFNESAKVTSMFGNATHNNNLLN